MPTLSSLAALEVVIMTTSGVASEDKSWHHNNLSFSMYPQKWCFSHIIASPAVIMAWVFPDVIDFTDWGIS